MKRIRHRSKLYKNLKYKRKKEKERRIKAFGEKWVEYIESF